VPIAAGGANWERTFAKNKKIGEAAIRYASVLVIRLPTHGP
jgi:hypothetical protein